MCPLQTQINLSISLVACVSSADSNQPVHQPSGMCPHCRLRSTWPSAWRHVCPLQTQINLSISLVACVSSADSDQPVHQPSGMCPHCRLRSTWPSAWRHVCPLQSQVKLVISLVACMSNADSNKPGHQPGGLCYRAHIMGAQWLIGRVLDSRPKGLGFEPHRGHCVVVLEQDTFILA